eukprot:1196303-Pleurochrysis_carterae.AAC.1
MQSRDAGAAFKTRTTGIGLPLPYAISKLQDDVGVARRRVGQHHRHVLLPAILRAARRRADYVLRVVGLVGVVGCVGREGVGAASGEERVERAEGRAAHVRTRCELRHDRAPRLLVHMAREQQRVCPHAVRHRVLARRLALPAKQQ